MYPLVKIRTRSDTTLHSQVSTLKIERNFDHITTLSKRQSTRKIVFRPTTLLQRSDFRPTLSPIHNQVTVYIIEQRITIYFKCILQVCITEILRPNKIIRKKRKRIYLNIQNIRRRTAERRNTEIIS